MLDDVTAAQLRRCAARLATPRSEVVRHAIREYAQTIERLSEKERIPLLRAFDQLLPQIPARPRAEVDREIRAVRTARRGRRT